jgi:hypothetical protein
LDQDLEFREIPVGNQPFSPDGAPVQATVKGIRVPQWKMVNGSAGEIPPGPLKIDGKLEVLTLIPYGCSNLRITEFPTVER